METIKGTVSKIKVLELSSQPLVRFTLTTDSAKIHCLVAAHSLSFLADVNENMSIVAYGRYNAKKQFVVKRYCVLGQTRIMIEFATSNFKRRKIS